MINMLEVLSGCWFIINVFGFIFFLSTGCNPVFINCVNPINVYDEVKVNWFGAWLIAIFCNIVFTVLAVMYWVWLLCTFGRKD